MRIESDPQSAESRPCEPPGRPFAQYMSGRAARHRTEKTALPEAKPRLPAPRPAQRPAQQARQALVILTKRRDLQRAHLDAGVWSMRHAFDENLSRARGQSEHFARSQPDVARGEIPKEKLIGFLAAGLRERSPERGAFGGDRKTSPQRPHSPDGDDPGVAAESNCPLRSEPGRIGDPGLDAGGSAAARAEEIAQVIETMTLSRRLHPRLTLELGRTSARSIEIHRIRQGEVDIDLVARDGGRALLGESLDELRAALSRRGLKVRRLRLR